MIDNTPPADIAALVALGKALIQKSSPPSSPAAAATTGVPSSTNEAPGGAENGNATSAAVKPGADTSAAADPRDAEILSLRQQLADQREQRALIGFLRNCSATTASGQPVLHAPAEDIAVLLAAKGYTIDLDAAGEPILRRGDEALAVSLEGLSAAGVPDSFLGTDGRGGTGSHGSTIEAKPFRELTDREYGRLTTAQKRAHREAAHAAMRGNR